MSDELFEHHPDGRKPFKSTCGWVFCAYSLECRPCHYGHRGDKSVECLLDGKTVRLFPCRDARLFGLEAEDYVSVEVVGGSGSG